MNEKFFDLKKEKQDRMINAALKVFAINGYAHASTDDIVKEADISKGLLFHYFTSKIGLYSFIYDYSTRFVILEMTSGVDKSDNDYFSLHMQIKNAESLVMKGYPYMLAFLESVKDENVVEALNEVSEKTKLVNEAKAEFFKHANTSLMRPEVDIDRVYEMIDCVACSVMKKTLRTDPGRPELYYREMKDYLILLKNVCYR